MNLGRAGTGTRLRDAALVLLACALAAACSVQRPEHRNVVVILADDLGWADVGFHGGAAATPNLDRLAHEGLAFERCYAQPTCTSSRAAFFTGRSPMRLGLGYATLRPWSEGGLDPAETLLPEPFRAAGYQTWLVGKWHLGHDRADRLPQAQGFEHFYGHLNGRVGYYDHRRSGGLDWQRDGVSIEEQGYATDLEAAEAVRLLRARDPERPFLLVLSFGAPHRPLEAPPEGSEPRPGESAEAALLRSMVESLDRGVGRVLSALDEEGLAQETLVLFASDNGGVEPASNAPWRGAKGSVHEGGIRVPCVLRLPGVLAAGARDARTVGFEDWLPTLATAAGIELESARPLDGIDLWQDLLRGKAPSNARPLFFASEDRRGVEAAVLRWPWKLVRRSGPGGGAARELLHDLERDPGESEDLAALEATLLAELGAELDAWLALEPSGGARFDSGRPPSGWAAPERWAEAVPR